MTMLINDSLDNCPNYKRVEFLKFYAQQFNCFVAGGCFKDLFENKRPKDIDLFFRDRKSFNIAWEKVKTNNRYIYVASTEDTKTFLDKVTGLNIQLICKYFFKNEKELLEDFDFTVSRFALYRDRFGTQVFRDVDYFTDLEEKRLNIEGDIKTPISTLKRAFRYASYGFNITPSSLKKLGLSLTEINPDDEEALQLYYEDIED